MINKRKNPSEYMGILFPVDPRKLPKNIWRSSPEEIRAEMLRGNYRCASIFQFKKETLTYELVKDIGRWD